MKLRIILSLLSATFTCCLTSYIPEGSTLPTGGLVWQNCTEPNEFYDCGSACQTECKSLGEPCPIVNFRCNDACYCVRGYARDEKQVCIPQEDCPGYSQKNLHLTLDRTPLGGSL